MAMDESEFSARVGGLAIVHAVGWRENGDGQFLAVWRDVEPPQDRLDDYHTLMSLGDMVELAPDTLDVSDVVDREDVVMDVWGDKREVGL